MTAQILSGKQEATRLQQELAVKIAGLGAKRKPGLAVILVGEDPASKIYINKKQQACLAVGIQSELLLLAESTTTEDLLNNIAKYNQDDNFDGILVQLPLPQHIDTTLVLEQIDPQKDVDGFHPYNLGRMAQGETGLKPCTPQGIMVLLAMTRVVLKGAHAVIIGQSNIVGMPLAIELIRARVTVTSCNRDTHDLSAKVLQADIVVSAAGVAGLVKASWVKPGAIVIDVGTNRLGNKLVGDVDFLTVKEVAGWITPVPGGVGPMTVAQLMGNTWLAYRSRA